jgi:hypothetical protein
MMPHPDELFVAAKQKLEQTQHDAHVANAEARLIRHWLAERVHYIADRLEPVNSQTASDLLPFAKRS